MSDSPHDGDALPFVLPTIRPRIVVDEDSLEESEEHDSFSLFDEMRAPEDEPEEALDPLALFEQMKAREEEPEEVLDPLALFEQMRAREVEPEETLDPAALFEQMRAQEAAAGDSLDPAALFEQMRAREAEAEDSLDPAALFERMRAREEEGPEDVLDPVTLFNEMRAREIESEDPLDPEALFGQMRAREAEPEALDPAALFEEMRAREVESDDSLDPVVLFEQMRSREVEPRDSLDPDALFEEIRTRKAESSDSLDPVVLFDQMKAREVEPEETLDPVALFEEMRARELESEKPLDSIETEDSLDPVALFEKMRAHETESEESPALLPDPEALFREMVAREREKPLPSGDDELPDPDTLFREMTRVEAVPEPVRAPKVGFFDKLKAAFGKKTPLDPVDTLPPPLPLPDAAAMFEALEVEEQLEALEHGFPSVTAAPLPALPDLDALRAELDAEMREELEPDLLGELSGPERFVDTVSDLTFQAGIFPALEASEPTLPSPPALHQPPASSPPSQVEDSPYRPAGGNRLEPSESRPEVLVSEIRSTSPPPPSPRPAGPPAAPVYRPTPSTTPASVKVAGGGKVAATVVDTSRRLWNSGVSISRTTLAILTRQLAAMLRSGIPLHQSLAFCAESDPRAAPVLEQVVSKVESGYSLSNALREFPESFDSVYVGLVQSGEMSGRINEMLEKLADVLERELELRKRLISVVTYPAMLLIVSLLGTLGFIFFVLPQLMPLFQDLKVDLPLPTKILLSLREVLLPVTVLMGLVALVIFLTRKPIKSAIASRPALQRRLANLALSIPVLGPVYEKIVISRVLYSMSSMLEVGVTMNQALARSEESAGNAQVAFRLARARQDLTEGATVTEAFRDNGVFPNSALQLISAGEESARTVEMFNFVAKSFDDEVEYAMQSAAGYLEPMIMVVMGLIVGFITIAAAMPTIQLLQNFG